MAPVKAAPAAKSHDLFLTIDPADVALWRMWRTVLCTQHCSPRAFGAPES
jgi:hypothetical protein